MSFDREVRESLREARAARDHWHEKSKEECPLDGGIGPCGPCTHCQGFQSWRWVATLGRMAYLDEGNFDRRAEEFLQAFEETNREFGLAT